jgi:lysophospholipase
LKNMIEASVIVISAVTAIIFTSTFLIILPQQRLWPVIVRPQQMRVRVIKSSPTGTYAPAFVQCPSTPMLRNVDESGLSQNETLWLAKREDVVYSAWNQYLQQLNISGLDVNQFLSDNATLGKIGIAYSGGGFRAMLNGAGLFNAMDSRNPDAVKAGTGGIIQLSTYMSGLSGGSFLVGALAINNFPLISQLVPLWNLDQSVIFPTGINIFTDIGYYGRLIQDVYRKYYAGYNLPYGFDITLTDLWGRAISYKLVNQSDGGPAVTYTDIRNQTVFASGGMPFPIVIADSRPLGQMIIPANTTIYEFNPFEFGSWNPHVRAFTPMQYLGTNLTNGIPVNQSFCVEGFENFGYIIGTSSSLFNQGLLRLNYSSTDILGRFIYQILEELGEDNNDIAVYPNTFYHYRQDISLTYDNPSLYLVDGGEDNENIPFAPLVVKERGVDTIIAIDSSADNVYHWPNGSSLVQTYEGSLDPGQNNTVPFPPVPSIETFINLELNARMTFFGCPNESNPNSSPLEGTNPYPMIIYIPNIPVSFQTNTSSFQFVYSNDDVQGFIDNGMGQLTHDNSTKTCLACGLMQRTFARRKQQLPTVCQECLDRHCWNGQRNDTKPAIYNPPVPPARAASAAVATTEIDMKLIIVVLLCLLLIN